MRIVRGLTFTYLIATFNAAWPADVSLIEEILVTAQRIEENAQKVPISVSAFTDAIIEDRQIVGVIDLQINVPNFSYTQENFGGARIVVRGIGDLFGGSGYQAKTGPSVPVHINQISTPLDVSVNEFYDLERVEVSRGPQGTLYGRNATAGAINFVTRRPEFDGFGGHVDVEYGDYDHTRVTGVLNLPVNEQLAFRLAGVSLDRDGYIENKAAGEIPGIDADMDSRDFYSFRITGEWRPNDDVRVWLIYRRFDEDDSKVRISNQVCRRNALPNIGCEPDAFGLDAYHPFAGIGGVLAVFAGAALPDVDSLAYEFSRPALDLREQHTDFNPVFEFEEDAWLVGVEWAFGPIDLSLSGSYFDSSHLSQQDYNMDVGFVLNPTAANPSGLWPTSGPAGPVGALRGGGPCDLESGLAGVFGPCVRNLDLNRSFVYDQADEKLDFWSTELRARSDLGGRIDFLLGVNYLHLDLDSQYYVFANMLDGLGLYGFPQRYPSFFNNSQEQTVASYSAFGELYVALTDELRLTLGLRYSYDEHQRDAAFVLFDAINTAQFLPGIVPDPSWIRGEVAGFLAGAPSPTALALADLYGATAAIQGATGPAELVDALQIVPITPRIGEASALGLAPHKDDWDEVTTRAALDWQVSADVMAYLSFTQGYRPGGLFGAAEESYDSEHVDAYEIGIKTLWASGSLLLNGAVFFNDFDDLQVWEEFGLAESRIKNIDAETVGVELEAQWRPIALPGLSLEGTYAWLDTKIKNTSSLDLLNRTQGDPNLVNLKSIDGGPSFVVGYTAPIDRVQPLVGTAVAAGAAVPALGTYGNGIPVYFSRSFLEANGVVTGSGRLASLNGNELPNSPRHSIRLGLAYTWTTGPGALTLRYDYYWQDVSYGREFNTRGDEIDSWDQHNAQVMFESADGRWVVRAWVRNIADEEIVTGHFTANDTSGNFRNYFLAEPRIYGASLRYNFGVID